MVEGSLTDTNFPALIFDCDGVLIDSEYLASRVESEQLHALGVELGVEHAHSLFLGKTVDGVLDAIAARGGPRPGSAWVYNWAFATAHAFMRELKAVDGVGVAIETLRRRGHRMAVASQSPLARVQLSLQVAGLSGQFGEHIYVSSMVARPKPAPDVYLLAAHRLGAQPADCIVIEDSPPAAAAALAAGMRAIGYAPGSTFEAMRATGATVIRTMDDLIARIDGAR
jgi:HAD superfamily hydrolase (TIGR01509 family)